MSDCFNQYLSEIIKIENNKRLAISKRYPILLPLIISIKRIFKYFEYTLNPKYFLNSKDNNLHWTNLKEHSSPLFRKFNKRYLDEGKIENIKLAIENIDGIIIPPGKIFSFWKYIGKPNIKKGYKKGLIISDSRLIEDTGGGLCQLSNLIAYLFASTQCEFVERKHHSRDVFPDSGRVVPFASGATVFFNLIDLKVKNVYDLPIKINLRITDTQLRGSIGAAKKLNSYIKIEEKDPCFIKVKNSGNIYRCNKIYRVGYTKISNEKVKESLLWKNIAKVLYDEKEIKEEIYELSL